MFFIFISETSGKGKKKRKIKGEVSGLRVLASILFNGLFFFWVWLGVGVWILGLFVAGVILCIASSLIVVLSIFSLIFYFSPVISDVLWAAFFVGSGIGILSFVGTWIVERVGTWFFVFTKWYIELNSRFIRK